MNSNYNQPSYLQIAWCCQAEIRYGLVQSKRQIPDYLSLKISAYSAEQKWVLPKDWKNPEYSLKQVYTDLVSWWLPISYVTGSGHIVDTVQQLQKYLCMPLMVLSHA